MKLRNQGDSQFSVDWEENNNPEQDGQFQIEDQRTVAGTTLRTAIYLLLPEPYLTTCWLG